MRVEGKDLRCGDDTVLCMSFNQDCTLLAVGTTGGFSIFRLDPFELASRRIFKGGLGVVEIMGTTNILALVGSGPSSPWDNKQIVLWDDIKESEVSTLPFQREVMAVKIQQTFIMTLTADGVYMHNTNFESVKKIDIKSDRAGVSAVAAGLDIFALPAHNAGQVQVFSMGDGPSSQKTEKFFTAHESKIAQLALSSDGTLLATASEKGTIIRIFKTSIGTEERAEKVKEFRRGTQQAAILSLCFSSDKRYLCATSESTTVHVFDLEATDSQGQGEAAQQEGNRKSYFACFSGISEYFKSEWSSAWATVAEPPCIAGFNGRELYVISAGGQSMNLEVPEKGGEMTVKSTETWSTQAPSDSP